jgi:mycothione reductase
MTHHDLIVIGTGSGNRVIDDSFADLDVAIVEEEHRFGGTCLNVGCIPTKMLAYTGEVVDTVTEAGRFDVRADLARMDWSAVGARVFGRLDPISRDGRSDRIDTPWITVYTGHAQFTGPRTLRVDGETLTGDNIVVATGSRPVVPPPVADAGLPYETSDTIMRRDRPPRRLAVLGGGYIAAELAHVFAATGAEIVMIEQADTLLGGQDETVTAELTALLAKRYDLRLGRAATRVSGGPGALRITLDDDSTVEADTLLVAVGRTPNGDRMNLEAGGVDVDDAGRIVVDAHQRTTAEGVWALGDVCTPVPLKHVANREADVVRHNLRHPDDLASAGHDLVPSAIFTHPQIAAVGATEQDLREGGVEYRAGLARFGDTAYGWAMEDETGFCKVLVDPANGAILGAHIMGPQASTLVQPLVLAATLGIAARTLVERPYWIHPALTEVVQQALIEAL